MQSLSPSSATLLILASCLLLAASVSDARPQPRRRPAATLAKSQRQVELVASTPYPAAGFRPSIPFDLPSERQPKLEEPLDTTTSIATSTVVEDFSTTDAQTTTEVEEQQQEEEEAEQQEEEEQLTEVEANARTPANTYGAPNPVEDTIEVVAQAPSRDFQPPVREAVEDFAAVAIDGVADEQQPVADLPALDQDLEQQEEEVTLKATATTPASTYGAPKAGTPARSYGAPELEEPDNELEVEESQVELFEEEQQQQDLSEAAAALGLNSGRLILLPLNAGGAQFGRLILAVEQPKAAATQQRQRQRQLRSERLRRRN